MAVFRCIDLLNPTVSSGGHPRNRCTMAREINIGGGVVEEASWRRRRGGGIATSFFA